MPAAPASLVSILEPWASFYGDSRAAQTLVTFAHVGGLLVAGGIAIATDRATLRMSSDVDRRRHVLDVRGAHRTVVGALLLVLLSGVLLLAADLETFWASPVYWVKMALVAVLLINGARLRHAERSISDEAPVPATHWNTLRHAAIASLVLWLATTLAGVALINYA